MALFAAFLCIVANGFFVAAEFALARVRPTALEAMAHRGDARAARALQATKQLDNYLTASQFGITLASLALGWLGEPALAHFIRPPLESWGMSETAVHGIATAFAFTVMSLLHIVVGELMPKSLAIVKPETVSRLAADPMRWFLLLMYPVLWILNTLSNWLLKTAGIRDAGAISEGEHKVSPEELRLLVQTSFADDDNRTKRDLLERVLRATDRPVRALMIPRVDMEVLSSSDDVDTWLKHIRHTGFSRYPVCDNGDPDKVVGYVYVKDLLLAEKQPKHGAATLKRDVLFVPESCQMGDLLEQFQRTGIPFAIVVDEYGGTAGLVTVEDVVEELVGELHDELDTEPPGIQTREDGTILVDGTVPMGDLPILTLDIPESAHGDTISGFIISQLGRLAHPGDHIRIGSHDATVEDVRRRRIARVALHPHDPDSVPPAPSRTDSKAP